MGTLAGVTGSRTARWAAAAIVVALVHAAPAAGGTNQLPSSLTLSASGSVTVTWQGDLARGCAAAGLCGTYGELILRSNGGSDGVRVVGAHL